MKILFSIYAIFASLSLHAAVDMRNANFTEVWYDIDVPGSGYDLRVERAYNSRSLHNGIFGFGWCSNFEDSLEVQSDGSLRVTVCGDGASNVFTPKGFTVSNIQEAIQKIAAEMKKRNPTLSASVLQERTKQMGTNARMREELAEQFGIKSPLKNGTRFYSTSDQTEYIEFKDKMYTHVERDGSAQKYGTDGKLNYRYDKNGNYLKFSYQEGILKDVTDNNGKKLTFSYTQNGKIKTIVGPNGTKAEYKYEGLNNLTASSSTQAKDYTYKYDELHNMTEIVYPDKTKKQLKYDINKDWVIGFTDRTGCTETYNYEADKQDPSNHYWSTVEKKCEGKVTNKSRYEFKFAMNKAAGNTYLQNVKTDINGDKSEYTYDETTGKPLIMAHGGVKTEFSYYPTGLMKTKKFGNLLTTFKYDPKNNKVSEVMIGKNKSFFKYDEKGNLVYAENTLGQNVKLSYDKAGRIVSIVDQAKKRVNIAYEEKFGKPSFVERPGLGSIKVMYKPNGEISKVESADGPHVAVQVASAFNNLLEIIAPAGIELSL